MNSCLQLNQPGFVLANARVLARASQAAYVVVPEMAIQTNGQGNYSEPLPLSGIVSYHNNTTGTHALITAYDDCTVIAFRGTACLRDWLTDAEFPLRPLPGTALRVHEGFLRAVESVLDTILARVDVRTTAGETPAATSGGTPDATGKPLVLTGHSLGGALAVLAAYLLTTQGYPVHSVYTFGQPRVGNRAFAAAYKDLRMGRLNSQTGGFDRQDACPTLGDRTFRLVNGNDVVPRVPGVLLGYHHAGLEAFINAVGRLVLNPSLAGRLVSDALGLYRAYRRLEDVLITDHFMERYVAALNETF